MLLIITTLHKKENAIVIGKGLLQKHLIACYNLFPVESAYFWKGKLLEENETLILMKTSDGNFEKIEKYIKKHSGYEVPEIIALSPDRVNTSYLTWINSETQSPK